MPSDDSGCPSYESLIAFARRDTADDENALEAHIKQCQACRERVHQERLLHWVGVDDLDDANGELRLPHDEHGKPLDAGSNPSIPGYRIIEEIHRGSQGIVYKAIRERTGQKVALKIMRDGILASSRARHHFQQEIHSLNRLTHPNIARVLDVDQSNDSTWYAMEYISGERIDAYVRDHAIEIRERVTLFTKVCAAVAHAHQRGIIHCDLKPSNILVDSQGEPHILDFGLARGALSFDGKPIAHVTMTGQLLGTLAYMAPEQAAGRASDIEIRTDVYALGVILYQLLTGRHPYSVDGPVFEVLRTIQEEQPARLRRINQNLNADLETIVLKTIAKDPGERYQSVDALRDDLERYLAGMPIIARSWSTFYLARKIVARHRFTAALVGLLCLAVLAVASVQAYRFATAPRVPFQDDFDDGVINSHFWAIGGTERGYGWPAQGSYRFTHSEFRADDGFLEIRIKGPTNADTNGDSYGAEAWLRTVYDYNDGADHLINFTWSAEVNADHVDGFAIQITDGIFPVGYDPYWWSTFRDGHVNLYQVVSSLETNDVGQITTAPQRWSIVINAKRRIATLYRTPDGKGEMHGEAWLDPTKPWHVCFFHMDVSSRGFAATDNALRVYEFSSVKVAGDRR